MDRNHNINIHQDVHFLWKSLKKLENLSLTSLLKDFCKCSDTFCSYKWISAGFVRFSWVFLWNNLSYLLSLIYLHSLIICPLTSAIIVVYLSYQSKCQYIYRFSTFWNVTSWICTQYLQFLLIWVVKQCWFQRKHDPVQVSGKHTEYCKLKRKTTSCFVGLESCGMQL